MAGPIVLAPPRESADLAITSVCGAALLFILGAVLFCSPRLRSARVSDPADPLRSARVSDPAETADRRSPERFLR